MGGLKLPRAKADRFGGHSASGSKQDIRSLQVALASEAGQLSTAVILVV